MTSQFAIINNLSSSH